MDNTIEIEDAIMNARDAEECDAEVLECLERWVEIIKSDMAEEQDT